MRDDQKRQIIKLYVEDGMGMERIGRIVKCERHSISRFLKSQGIEIRKPKDYRGATSPTFRGVGELSLTFWNQIKYGAELRDLSFEITIEFAWELLLSQNFKCALSGLDITLNGGTNKYKRTASLDRKDSNVGYIEDNVWWVHRDINLIKADLQIDEFIDYCRLIAQHN